MHLSVFLFIVIPNVNPTATNVVFDVWTLHVIALHFYFAVGSVKLYNLLAYQVLQVISILTLIMIATFSEHHF